MGLFLKFGDDEVDFGDTDPKIVLPIMRKYDVYWGDFNPFRDIDIGAEIARAVGLARETPVDVSQYDVDTLGGLGALVNDHWGYVAGTDLPKTSTTADSQSTDDQTTETSPSSSSPSDGNQTEPEV